MNIYKTVLDIQIEGADAGANHEETLAFMLAKTFQQAKRNANELSEMLIRYPGIAGINGKQFCQDIPFDLDNMESTQEWSIPIGGGLMTPSTLRMSINEQKALPTYNKRFMWIDNVAVPAQNAIGVLSEIMLQHTSALTKAHHINIAAGAVNMVLEEYNPAYGLIHSMSAMGASGARSIRLVEYSDCRLPGHIDTNSHIKWHYFLPGTLI